MGRSVKWKSICTGPVQLLDAQDKALEVVRLRHRQKDGVIAGLRPALDFCRAKGGGSSTTVSKRSPARSAALRKSKQLASFHSRFVRPFISWLRRASASPSAELSIPTTDLQALAIVSAKPPAYVKQS